MNCSLAIPVCALTHINKKQLLLDNITKHFQMGKLYTKIQIRMYLIS